MIVQPASTKQCDLCAPVFDIDKLQAMMYPEMLCVQLWLYMTRVVQGDHGACHGMSCDNEGAQQGSVQ